MQQVKITFEDGRTFKVGQRVEVYAGSVHGIGTIIGIDPNVRNPKPIKVKLDADVKVGEFDRWPLRTGGYYDRCRDGGVAGGEILRIVKEPDVEGAQFKFRLSHLGYVIYDVSLPNENFQVHWRHRFDSYERSITNYPDDETKDRMVGATVGMIYREDNPREPLPTGLVEAFNAWREAEWTSSLDKMRAQPEKYGNPDDADVQLWRPVPTGSVHLVCEDDGEYRWVVDVPAPAPQTGAVNGGGLQTQPESYDGGYDGILERLQAGHVADDIPLLMADLGVDYDLACDAVFGENHAEAIRLLKDAQEAKKTAAPGI